MALSTEVRLTSDQDSLEVAVGVRLGKVDLKVCPAPSRPGTEYSNIYPVLHQKEESIAVLRLKKNSKSSDVVTYTVTTVADGECIYRSNKLPPISAVHKGVAYKINRFLGKVVFKISADEMAHWAKSVAKDMVVDARRHARSMATIK
jgi:hypothetical protein